MRDFLAVHTSDRALYKRCRRKWDFRSRLRRNLVPTQEGPNIHLWLGTGFHFALEDFHGYNRFGDPVKALEAYYNAFRQSELPEGAEEAIGMAMGMLEHYRHWLRRRDLYQTVWVDGKPLVEVKFELELQELSEFADIPVYYRGTMDRIVTDSDGQWWVQDYKTAARIDTAKLANDPQISTYVWAAEQIFQREFAGMIYSQFAKKVPNPPRELTRGGISLDKRQNTTHYLYKQSLLNLYPSGNFPGKYREFLGHLAEKETPEGDEYIRFDAVERNTHAKISEYKHIINEGREMVSRDLPIYPNRTRDCSWDCSEFRQVCIAMDEGDDWEYLLEEFYAEQPEEGEEWQRRIQWPEIVQ